MPAGTESRVAGARRGIDGDVQRVLALACPVALSIVAAGGAACGDEQALVVDLTVRGDGDRLCLAAFGDGQVVFERAYAGDPPPEGSLTLVAGDRVADSVRVTAWLTRGGRVVGRATGESGFGHLDELHLPLGVARCTPRPAMAPASLRTVTTVDVAEGASLAAVDFDADGRAELLLVNADGELVAVDAEPEESALRPIDAPLPPGAVPVGGAALDEDCGLDVLAVSGEGVVVVRAAEREPETRAPVGPHARAVESGSFQPGRARLAIAGADGLALADWEGGAPQILDEGAFAFLAVGDLTSDGIDDLVATSDGGVRVWLGSGAGLAEVVGAVPASFATVDSPVAVGDLDDDGALDLVGAAGNVARLAHNRGDGLLQDRTGATPASTASPIARVLLVDLDGDCRDDLVLADADGAVVVFRSGPDLTLVPESPSLGAVWDVVAADVDGDGWPELAALTRAGALQVWGR